MYFFNCDDNALCFSQFQKFTKCAILQKMSEIARNIVHCIGIKSDPLSAYCWQENDTHGNTLYAFFGTL